MFCTIKVRSGLIITVACVLIAAFSLSLVFKLRSVDVAALDNRNCLVIDPGHGGIDGGAVAISGDKESDINLSISKKLALIAQLYGEYVVMTRDNDNARSDAMSYSEHEDLVYRTEIINSKANAVLISIHQNCFPTSQPKGAQVLYADNDLSRSFGNTCHNNIVDLLQPDNRRVAEPASKKLFITANAKCPAILVECGFMSNTSDLENLKNQAYQTALSGILFASYIQFRYP